MSYPKNKRERLLIGRRKGFKRVSSWFYVENPDEDFRLKSAKCHRNTTKRCSCSICTNPRRSGWSKQKEKLTLQERKFLDFCED